MTPNVRAWRRWTWFLVAWSIVAILLAILALGALGDACVELRGIGLSVCEAGATIGSILAIIVVFLVWLVGFLLLAIGWFARRPIQRLCPPYGHSVEEGESTCPECGYDFVAGSLPATGEPGPAA